MKLNREVTRVTSYLRFLMVTISEKIDHAHGIRKTLSTFNVDDCPHTFCSISGSKKADFL